MAKSRATPRQRFWKRKFLRLPSRSAHADASSSAVLDYLNLYYVNGTVVTLGQLNDALQAAVGIVYWRGAHVTMFFSMKTD